MTAHAPRTPSSTALGRTAETLALEWYLTRGYVLLDRNARLGPLELDLVVARGGTVVFVEVRARKDLRFGHPAATVDGRKQGRLRAAATRWLVRHPERRALRPRFDVVAIVGHGPAASLTVYEDAF